MGKIVVAYDGSDQSKKALRKAETLLKPGDEIFLVSVVPKSEKEEFFDISPVLTRQNFEEMIDETTPRLREAGMYVKGFILEGDVADEIINFSAKVAAGLIILGYRGVSKIAPFALGSVAENVSKHATRPVMIVR